MDAGSYVKKVIKVVEGYSDYFYIRAERAPKWDTYVNESTRGWRKIKLSCSNGGVRELEVRSFDE